MEQYIINQIISDFPALKDKAADLAKDAIMQFNYWMFDMVFNKILYEVELRKTNKEYEKISKRIKTFNKKIKNAGNEDWIHSKWYVKEWKRVKNNLVPTYKYLKVRLDILNGKYFELITKIHLSLINENFI